MRNAEQGTACDDKPNSNTTDSQWHFAVKRCVRISTSDGPAFMAWCARTPDLGATPMDIPFDEEVHFEFGDTAGEALRKLKAEVLR